ncbi:DUF4435 domain-containing protein [Xanthobacter sp. VTT E-85241]|uniref:DUF4435 domain-containing protein n=1 Tax=Roseixanthobacter finlandensis TaxID=3119922 RepID=UPI003727585B
MNNDNIVSIVDNSINDLRRGRKQPSVVKSDLIALRSFDNSKIVLVFEGLDDKIAYHSWLKRLDWNLKYEALPCSGKKCLLQFREMIKRDLNNLNKNVLFFVDRDYDDLGVYEAGPDIFVTDKYSIENYLVSGDVLAEILQNEFHCHVRPDIRSIIIDEFEALYDSFLIMTKSVNFQLYLEANKVAKFASPAPSNVSDMVDIRLREVILRNSIYKEIEYCISETDSANFYLHKSIFDNFYPRDRYRGKYNHDFFIKWINLLFNDYNNMESIFFPKCAIVAITELGSMKLH